MNIETKGRFGKFNLSFACEMSEEEAKRQASENAKTAIASALGFKDREGATRSDLEAAILKLKAPKGLSNIKVSIDGDWSSKSGPTASAVAASMVLGMRAAKIDEAAIQAACLAAGVPYSLPAPTVEPVKTTDGVELSEG